MDNPIMVSIVCIAYNQEKYIRSTLDGFVNQETNFKYEVLIHDDASSDRTAEIIMEYANRYPKLIKPIIQKENQYSKGINAQTVFNYSRINGRYVAYCEGDDYWCDNKKLQKQFDNMENHSECSICVHDTQCIDRNGKVLPQKFPRISIKPGIISATEYIHNELCVSNWLFQTSSYFIRREVIDFWREKFDNPYPMGDLPLVLLSLQFGDCFYIDEICSCYRKDSGGAMSRLRNDSSAAIQYYERIISAHKKFDVFSNKLYHKDFDYAIRSTELQIHKLKGEFKEIKNCRYSDIFNGLNWKNKALCYIGMLFPRLSFYVFNIIRKHNRNG